MKVHSEEVQKIKSGKKKKEKLKSVTLEVGNEVLKKEKQKNNSESSNLISIKKSKDDKKKLSVALKESGILDEIKALKKDKTSNKHLKKESGKNLFETDISTSETSKSMITYSAGKIKEKSNKKASKIDSDKNSKSKKNKPKHNEEPEPHIEVNKNLVTKIKTEENENSKEASKKNKPKKIEKHEVNVEVNENLKNEIKQEENENSKKTLKNSKHKKIEKHEPHFEANEDLKTEIKQEENENFKKTSKKNKLKKIVKHEPHVEMNGNLETKIKKKKKHKLNKVSEENEMIHNGTIENSQNKNDKVNKKSFSKKESSKIKNNKNKENNILVPSMKEAPEFDENNFNSIVNFENIKKTVNALKKIVEKQGQSQKNKIFKDYNYILNICLYKIPSAPKRLVKLELKHSLVGEDGDVLFFVRDLKRGSRIDFEPTIHHYEDLLREHDVKGIKTIMPINQLKKEYKSYEARRKLLNMYDYFICDAKISSHIFAILGRGFHEKSRAVYSVRTNKVMSLKNEIKKSLKKTCMRQGVKGNYITICIGRDSHTTDQVTDNIMVAIDQLKNNLPGGFPNIRNLGVKVNMNTIPSLPLYINMGKPPSETPYIVGQKEQKMKKLKAKAEKILQNFTFTKDGGLAALSSEETNLRKRKFSESSEVAEKKKKKKDKKTETIENTEENAPKKVKKNKKVKIESQTEKIQKKKKRGEDDEVD